MTRDVLDTLYGNTEIHIPESLIEPQVDQSPNHSFEQSPEISEILEQEVVPSTDAPGWVDGFQGKDLRPRLQDGDTSYLLDTGSMACVWPAEPGDKVDKSISLQTVDGSPFNCYGRKELTIKLGRKTYSITAGKAKIKSPIRKLMWVWL